MIDKLRQYLSVKGEASGWLFSRLKTSFGTIIITINISN
jgi:hypothetical protein